MGGGAVTLLVTRPQPDADVTVSRLADLGIAAIAMPLLVRQNLVAALPDPTTLGAIVFTSTNAIRALSEIGEIGHYIHLDAFAVGARTATEARAAGFGTVRSADGGLDELTSLLEAMALTRPLFYPAAQERSGELAPRGVPVITVPVYAMLPIDAVDADIAESLAAGSITGALFYSRRTALTFASLAGKLLAPVERARLPGLCLSTIVAEPLIASGYAIAGIAAERTDAAMLSLALAFTRARNTPS